MGTVKTRELNENVLPEKAEICSLFRLTYVGLISYFFIPQGHGKSYAESRRDASRKFVRLNPVANLENTACAV